MAYALRNSSGRPEIVRDPIEVRPEEPLAVELRSFIRAVRGEDERCVTAREGLAALRAARQVVEQIGRGR